MTLGPLMIDVAGERVTPAERRLLSAPAVGGVILFARNFKNYSQILELTKEIKEIRSPELLVAVDQEGGRVQRFQSGFTRLPPMRDIGRLFDNDAQAARDLARETGWLLGSELAAVGVDFSFAPVVDIDRGVSDVIGDRAFHNDPETIAELATALSRGLADAGQVAVGKHFPGHGGVVADSHHELPTDRREFADLAADLVPFQRLVRENVAGIMTAHVVYSACDPLPPTISPWWLGTVLREQMAFDGVIFSDDLDMKATRQFGSIPDCADQALAAGCDMVLVCNNRAAAEETAERLADYSSPPSMLRRARLRGEVSPALPVLRESDRWQRTVADLERLGAKPEFELKA